MPSKNDYRLHATKHQWILQQFACGKKRGGEETTYWSNVAYYPSLQTAARAMIEVGTRQCVIDGTPILEAIELSHKQTEDHIKEHTGKGTKKKRSQINA